MPLDVLWGRQSGWLACFLVEVGLFLELQKVSFFRGSAGFSFDSVQFALLGVIADSEYVDCMGNNRTSNAQCSQVDLGYIRMRPLNMHNS